MKLPIVIVPHVSWRRLSLLQLLDSLSKQTRRVKVIVLHDDPDEACGEHENIRLDQTTQRFLHRPKWWPLELKGGVTPSSRERAQCERWKLIEEIATHDTSPEGIWILTLDDDMQIPLNYIERTRQEFMRLESATTDPVLSWGGVDTDYRWRHYNEQHGACELVLPQAGAMAFYADTFVGLGATKLAQLAHVRGGSEELPVAAFLEEKDLRIFRPSGCGPQPTKDAYDPRSSYKTTQVMLRTILDQCIADPNGWPHARAIQQLLAGKRPRAAGVRA